MKQLIYWASHDKQLPWHPKASHQQNNLATPLYKLRDGDHLAFLRNITISDFRQKHIAAWREVQPLAVYGDYLIL